VSEAVFIHSSGIADRQAGEAYLLKFACMIAVCVLLATHASAGELPSYTETAKPEASECEPDTPAYQAIRGCSNLLGSPDTDPQMRIRIYTMRGYAWLKEEEPLAAVSDFSRAIQLDASNASAIKGRARAFEILKQYGDAIEDWTRLIAAKPSEPENYRERAYTYHLNGNYKLAVADFTTVLKLDENNIDSWIGRANAYDALDKIPEALADFEGAIKVDAKYPAVFTARAEMWDRRGENLKAIADYQESLRLNSINLKVRQALQRLGISHPYP